MRTVSSTTIVPDDVGQDLPGHDEQPVLATQARRRDVVELRFGQHGGADGARHDRGEQDGDRPITTSRDEPERGEDRAGRRGSPGSTAAPRRAGRTPRRPSRGSSPSPARAASRRRRSSTAAIGAAMRTSRAPAMTRDSTSRPSWSVPIRCSAARRLARTYRSSLIGSYGVMRSPTMAQTIQNSRMSDADDERRPAEQQPAALLACLALLGRLSIGAAAGVDLAAELGRPLPGRLARRSAAARRGVRRRDVDRHRSASRRRRPRPAGSSRR